MLVDSGFRRGTDIVNALAIGPANETRAAMQQCGVRSIKEINPGLVRRV